MNLCAITTIEYPYENLRNNKCIVSLLIQRTLTSAFFISAGGTDKRSNIFDSQLFLMKMVSNINDIYNNLAESQRCL